MKYLSLIFILINLNLYSQLNASFTANNLSGCSPLNVQFTNTSTNGVSFLWDFGNGTSSILNNPSAIFTNPGFYSVKLVAYNGPDSDSIIKVNYIEVLNKPTANFNYTIIGSCEEDNLINFSNTSIGSNSCVWDFGNGDTNSLNNPNYSYFQPGSYPVTLIAYNGLGCSDDTVIGPIVINPTPILNVSSDTTIICDSSYNFTFTGISSNSTITSWQWDFGDGYSTSTTFNSIQYSYDSSNTFNPSVTGISSDGCIDSINLDVIVILPFEIYTLSSSTNLGCPPLNVNFNISPTDSIQNINWDFDDGNLLSGNLSPTNQFLNNGVFHPSAIVENLNGCFQQIDLIDSINISNSPSATFNLLNTSGCPPLSVQFNIFSPITNIVDIDFGDGNPISNLNNITHTYSDNGIFYPILTITDTNNCQSIYNMDTVYSGISNIDFSASKVKGCAPLKVDFSSIAPSATSWAWDFGDGHTSTDENPENTYDSAGSYSVTLVAYDVNSCFDTLIKMNYILVEKEIVNIVTIDTITACSPYVFNTDVYNIGVNFWDWDFGDGNIGNGQSVNHTYDQPGTYNISLFTDAPNGCKYDLNNFAFLKIDGIDINVNINSNCSSGLVDIVNNSTGVTQHLWNMGDGVTYTTANVQHTYSTSQSYVITYESISEIGCNNFEYYSAIFDCNPSNPIIINMPAPNPINPLIDPITNIPIGQSCGPESVNLNSPFPTAISWEWDFGDGNFGNGQNTSHYYSTAGTFNLNHIANYIDGSSDTLTINNFIDQYTLDADFSLIKNEFCNNNTYIFETFNDSAASYEWSLDSNIISNILKDSINLQLNDSVSVLNLKITDKFGCIGESQQNVFLYHPLAIIKQDTFACFGSNIFVECCVKDEPIHNWDMTDGNLITLDTTFTHEYQQTGWFNPILTLNNTGCMRQIVLDSIEIFEPDATFSPTNIPPICKNDSVLFVANNSSYSMSSYNWSGGLVLGTGDSIWIKINSNSSQAIISLNINNRGCNSTFKSDTIIVNNAYANFSYNISNNCVPIDVNFQDSSINPTDWKWDFNNGLSSNLQNPTQQFSSFPIDSIQLKITDLNGCSDSVRKKIKNDFNADFTVSDTLICARSNIIFNPLSEIVNSWSWDFGDGNISTDSTPSHNYQSAGIYNVKLIASDGQGCIDTVMKTAFIRVNEVIADFSFNITGSCPPVVTTFTNLSSGASNYYWDFGDNLNSINTDPAHIYNKSGYFDVSLISTNNLCSDTLLINNLVFIPGPVLNFSVNQLSGCDSLNISITDSSLNTVYHKYFFGDGDTSNLQNPTHTYTSPGAFQITLRGEDSAGCQKTLTSSNIIKIDLTPIINFQVSDSILCINSLFSVTNNSLNTSNHSWLYGSLNSNIMSPNIIANLIGSNPLQYIAKSANSICFDTSYVNINASDIPNVSITNPGILCTNQGPFDLNCLNDSIYSNLIWSGNGIIDSNNGTIATSILIDSTTIYVSHDSICSSTDSIIIIVDIPPDASILTNDTSYCEGSSILTPLVVNASGYWLGQNVDSLTGNVVNNLIPNNYLYEYVLTNNNNCKDTGSYQIQIIANSDATIINPGIICNNLDSLQLYTNENGGIWTGLNVNNGLIDINALGTGIHDFTYTINGVCPDEDTLSLEIFEFIQAQINPIVDFCEGTDSVQFSASTNVGYWAGLPSLDSLSGLLISDTIQDGSYYTCYIIDGNCPSVDTLNFTILPKPEINISFSQLLPCVGYQLDVVNSSNNISNEDFSWYINDSLYYQNFNEPYFNLDTGFYKIKVEATNQFNCFTEEILYDSFPIYDTTRLDKSEIIRSTVVENINIYTEWFSNKIELNPLVEYSIFRSENGNDFEFITSLDSSINNYTDVNVEVMNSKYDYIIVNKNICSSNSLNSNLGNSILLNFQRLTNFRTKLNWNFYNGWIDNPNRYDIQKLNSDGNWETIQSNVNTENEIIINE